VKLTEQQVRYVAGLANLAVSDEEIGKLHTDIEGILEHFDKLNEVDTTGVEPMAQVLSSNAGKDTLREDQVVPPLDNHAALANAPQPGAGYFKVPKVIER
jgi:aspartyl-tRNA(Asn)/glutamyl-tRNA(Gln) amidotransferase subunit C